MGLPAGYLGPPSPHPARAMRSNRLACPGLAARLRGGCPRLSFSPAGEELFVTQGAISHHIQRLRPVPRRCSSAAPARWR